VNDADSDGALDCQEIAAGSSSADVDTDDDGCSDGEELAGNKALGGRRSPTNFWDLYDVWTGTIPNLVRNQAVAATDINNVISRFGASGAATSVADALTEPSSTTGYHAAFDRGPSIGPNPWNLGQANGAIAATDINAVIAQFGDNCLAAP
jgi:hypothetical protein